jgi:hypothetical protein
MEVYLREYIRACEAFGWEGGPEFSTDITAMVNKREKRNAMWSQSRFFASLPFQNIPEDTYDDILDMFEDRMGRWGAFLYRDPVTHTAELDQFGIGDGAEAEFQLGIYVGRVTRLRKRNIAALYVPDTGRTNGIAGYFLQLFCELFRAHNPFGYNDNIGMFTIGTGTVDTGNDVVHIKRDFGNNDNFRTRSDTAV